MGWVFAKWIVMFVETVCGRWLPDEQGFNPKFSGSRIGQQAIGEIPITGDPRELLNCGVLANSELPLYCIRLQGSEFMRRL